MFYTFISLRIYITDPNLSAENELALQEQKWVTSLEGGISRLGRLITDPRFSAQANSLQQDLSPSSSIFALHTPGPQQIKFISVITQSDI